MAEVFEQFGQHGSHIIAGDRTPATVGFQAYQAGAGLVGQRAGAQDRPVEALRARTCVVGRALGAQVGVEDRQSP